MHRNLKTTHRSQALLPMRRQIDEAKEPLQATPRAGVHFANLKSDVQLLKVVNAHIWLEKPALIKRQAVEKDPFIYRLHNLSEKKIELEKLIEKETRQELKENSRWAITKSIHKSYKNLIKSDELKTAHTDADILRTDLRKLLRMPVSTA